MHSKSSSLGFLEVLFLIIFTLKLCDVIDWSWLWILAPLWITAGVVLAAILLYGLLSHFTDL